MTAQETDVERIVRRHLAETELERQLWRYGPPAWAVGMTRREVVQQLRSMTGREGSDA
jgi:hypothetical protein